MSTHPFLSEGWFQAFEALDAPPASGPAAALSVNVVVTGAPDGDSELHMAAGTFKRGLLSDAPTTLTVPYDVARAIFVDDNQMAAMQAFATGQITVQGDMSKLMAMQAGGMAPSPEQLEFRDQVRAITA